MCGIEFPYIAILCMVMYVPRFNILPLYLHYNVCYSMFQMYSIQRLQSRHKLGYYMFQIYSIHLLQLEHNLCYSMFLI